MVTAILVIGFLVYQGAMLLYVLPVTSQPAPPDAVPEWRDEQIKQRLRGKKTWFLVGSYGAVALVGIAWLNRRARRSG